MYKLGDQSFSYQFLKGTLDNDLLPKTLGIIKEKGIDESQLNLSNINLGPKYPNILEKSLKN